MKRLQKILGASLVSLALSGCGSCDDYEINYIEGEVVREGGSLVRNLAESSGAFFGNESVKVGKPTYVLTVKTDEGIYTMKVKNTHAKPIEALAQAIEEGSRVKFAKNSCRDMGNVTYKDHFSQDRIGSIYSTHVQVL